MNFFISAALASLLRETFGIEAGMQPMRWEEILDAWRTLSVTSARPVKVVTALETVEGIAEDVDASGALLVRLTSENKPKPSSRFERKGIYKLYPPFQKLGVP